MKRSWDLFTTMRLIRLIQLLRSMKRRQHIISTEETYFLNFISTRMHMKVTIGRLRLSQRTPDFGTRKDLHTNIRRTKRVCAHQSQCTKKQLLLMKDTSLQDSILERCFTKTSNLTRHYNALQLSFKFLLRRLRISMKFFLKEEQCIRIWGIINLLSRTSTNL